MRVMVLGGTRFIGRAVVEDLAGSGHEVHVIHRGQTEPPDLVPVPHWHVDRFDEPALRNAMTTFDPQAFVDTRAMTGAEAEAALAALPRTGARLVVLSSVDVYRAFGSLEAGIETDPVPLDETFPVRTERYLYQGRPGLDDYEKLDVEPRYLDREATVLRLPMVYGEHDPQRREEFVLRRVRAGRRRIPVGPGTWLSCRGYVGEIARAVRLAVESERAAGEVINLCEERTWSVAMWAVRILDAAGSDAELVRAPDEVLPEDMEETKGIAQHLLVDPSKARDVLGWIHGDPDPLVRRSVAWHLANPPQAEDPDFSADDRALAASAPA